MLTIIDTHQLTQAILRKLVLLEAGGDHRIRSYLAPVYNTGSVEFIVISCQKALLLPLGCIHRTGRPSHQIQGSVATSSPPLSGSFCFSSLFGTKPAREVDSTDGFVEEIVTV